MLAEVGAVIRRLTMTAEPGTQARALQWLTRLTMFSFGASTAVVAVAIKNIGGEFELSHSELGGLGFVRGVTLAGVVTISGFLAGRYGKKRFLAGTPST